MSVKMHTLLGNYGSGLAAIYSRRHIGRPTDSGVNMLGLCDTSNLLFVLSTEEQRAILKLL